MNDGRKIRVLVVDDSALIRKLLTDILNSDPQIEVVDTAMDPFIAREKIKKHNPDVLTLDVEMPRMDGVTFLRNLMRLRPMPVLMVSTLTEQGADITLEALRCGAVDFVTKPKVDVSHTLQDYAVELIEKVKAAAGARVRQLVASPRPVEARLSVDQVMPVQGSRKHFRTTDRLIAIGASTGGTEAIREVLEMLPVTMPGIVITQHIPSTFSGAFAQRMDRSSALDVSEARDGEQILPGHAYIAPGGKHLSVVRDGARYRCRVSDESPVNRHKPSVDVLFRSVAQNVGQNAIGVILTGMGKDGAQGLLEMREAGAHTIAQDEASSVVWGMPGSAVAIEAAVEVLSLGSIAASLVRHAD